MEPPDGKSTDNDGKSNNTEKSVTISGEINPPEALVDEAQSSSDHGGDKHLASHRPTSKMCQICAFEAQNIEQIQDICKEINVSALHKAAFSNHKDCILAALDSGIQVDVLATGGITPLMMACMRGNVEIVELLIKYGANTNLSSKPGGPTPILSCVKAEKNQTEALQVLLKHGADVNHKFTYDNFPFSVLSYAVSVGAVDCIKVMIEFGALFDMDEFITEKRTYLEYLEICFINRRLQHKITWRAAEKILLIYYEQTGELSKQLCSALVRKSDTDVLLQLFDRNIKMKDQSGSSSTILDPVNAGWLLQILTSDDKVEQLRVTLEHNHSAILPQIDVECGGFTALQSASVTCDIPVLCELLSHGADPNRNNSSTRCRLPIVQVIIRLPYYPRGLQLVIRLLRYQCSLDVKLDGEEMEIEGIAEVNLMDLALLWCNLYAAQILLLSGVNNYCRGDISAAKVDLADKLQYDMSCTTQERDAFITSHLNAPLSLYIQSRQAVRKALGTNADNKVPDLGLSSHMEEFLLLKDLDRIAKKFKVKMEQCWADEDKSDDEYNSDLDSESTDED